MKYTSTFRRLIAIIFILLFGQSAHGCRCGYQSLDVYLSKSDAVFSAKVISIERDTLHIPMKKHNADDTLKVEYYDYTIPTANYWMKVDQVFCGVLLSDTIIVQGSSGNNCYYPFEIGKSYLIMATNGMLQSKEFNMHKQAQCFSTNRCTGTGTYTKKYARQVKRAIRKRPK